MPADFFVQRPVVTPTIYVYTLPGVASHTGYIKVGYTERDVEKRIHDLRHSCASLLISQGNSIKAVSAHLGHSNTEQTLNTYAHLFPQDTEKIVASLKSATCAAKPSENK